MPDKAASAGFCCTAPMLGTGNAPAQTGFHAQYGFCDALRKNFMKSTGANGEQAAKKVLTER
ncbi:MAG: hypothetical protein WCD66_09795 [Rhodanobacteraceae bacterium]